MEDEADILPMCESKVYLKDGDEKQIVMEEAIYIKVQDDKITVQGVLGDTKIIENGRIVLMDMDRHEVHIELFQ